MSYCEITAWVATDFDGTPLPGRHAETTIWTGKSRLRSLGALMVARAARPKAALSVTWLP